MVVLGIPDPTEVALSVNTRPTPYPPQVCYSRSTRSESTLPRACAAEHQHEYRIQNALANYRNGSSTTGNRLSDPRVLVCVVDHRRDGYPTRLAPACSPSAHFELVSPAQGFSYIRVHWMVRLRLSVTGVHKGSNFGTLNAQRVRMSS